MVGIRVKEFLPQLEQFSKVPGGSKEWVGWGGVGEEREQASILETPIVPGTSVQIL